MFPLGARISRGDSNINIRTHLEDDVRVVWDGTTLDQCFSTAGPQPGTGPRHQLYRAARGSPGICHFSFL